MTIYIAGGITGFPSPCGVWVVSSGCKLRGWCDNVGVSVPLRGVGCFPTRPERYEDRAFPSPCGVWVVSEKYGYTESDSGFPSPCGEWVVSIGGCMTKLSILVSVSLRGVGCFQQNRSDEKWANGFRPLAGCGLFRQWTNANGPKRQFPSPCGVWVVSYGYPNLANEFLFPSPCGVWVVSAKLHILSGATGKRIVNSAILLYHIGRCLSIAN